MVASTFTDGLQEISKSIRSILGSKAHGQVEIYAARTKITQQHVKLMNLPQGVTVYRTHAEADFTTDTFPRAEISLDATTWHTPNTDANPARIYCHWELRVCPPGVDPNVHELAEALIWDAESTGHHLDRETAMAIATAIEQNTIRRLVLV